MGQFMITLYYVTRGTKSITHGLTNYLRCRNKLWLSHRRNINASVVETKSVSDACTMLAPHLIIDESVLNQTKCSLVVMTTTSLLTSDHLFQHCKLLFRCCWLLLEKDVKYDHIASDAVGPKMSSKGPIFLHDLIF